jgi:hypothetical protein
MVSHELTRSYSIQAAEQAAGAASAQIVLVSPSDIHWGPAPMVVPAGAEAVVIEGDPSKDGMPDTLRLKMPDGYRVGPHYHPTDENVTVKSGTLGIGMGDKFDSKVGQLVKPGGFVYMPKQMHHYAWAKGSTDTQIHGLGPFASLT